MPSKWADLTDRSCHVSSTVSRFSGKAFPNWPPGAVRLLVNSFSLAHTIPCPCLPQKPQSQHLPFFFLNRLQLEPASEKDLCAACFQSLLCDLFCHLCQRKRGDRFKLSLSLSFCNQCYRACATFQTCIWDKWLSIVTTVYMLMVQ